MREGDRFEGYVVQGKIGEGGMAEVFRAERVGAMGISRAVCIKRIRSESCGDPAFVRSFVDEARISSTLCHGNIVSVEHFGLAEGVPFMVMEWVHGADVARLLERLHAAGQRVPFDAALFIVASVLDALEYAHARTDHGQWLQIVHRDVSPHNVMVSFEGHVKLMDFGIAKATSRLQQTCGHVIKGKVCYMAPEQAMGPTVDRRADLFSLGVVAYEMLAGRLPFASSDDPIEAISALLSGARPRLSDLRRDLPRRIEVFVDRLLAPRPEDRFADAGAARDALNAMPVMLTGARTLQGLMHELFNDEETSSDAPTLRAPTFHSRASETRRVTRAARAQSRVAWPAARGGKTPSVAPER